MGNTTPNKATKKVSTFWAVVVPVLVAMLAPLMIIGARQYSLSKVDNFADCKDAGGEVLESNPEKCTVGDKTFTNKATQPNKGDKELGDDEYVGLTEKEAFEKAKRLNKPARVVERDGEAQAVTMDLRPGRLNFTVKDGKVAKLDVEAPEMQPVE